MMAGPLISGNLPDPVFLHGARCATGSRSSDFLSLEIAGGRIQSMRHESAVSRVLLSGPHSIDLTGYLILPGLINAHDHLEFGLYPRLADPPYRNYIEWGIDIHRKFPELIALHRAVPKEVRVWWGGIRNLLCGVTTVGHHNPLHPEMLSDGFPVRVNRRYGWAHSPALGGDLLSARAATPEGTAFIVHACEGTDEVARQEVHELDRLGLLDARAVLVHGLALGQRGVALLVKRHASLIVCPSSNQFLFGALPNLSLLTSVPNLSLGNDSPLTAAGDLLDELRFAMNACCVEPSVAYGMVTTAPSSVLRLTNGEGTLSQGGVGDLIAVRDTGQQPADRLRSLTMHDVEFVMLGGRIQLSSETLLNRLSKSVEHGLEPLLVDGTTRWLRAPVAHLLHRAEEVLGRGQVRPGHRAVSLPAFVKNSYVA